MFKRQSWQGFWVNWIGKVRTPSRSAWMIVPITELGCPRRGPAVHIKGMSQDLHLVSLWCLWGIQDVLPSVQLIPGSGAQQRDLSWRNIFVSCLCMAGNEHSACGWDSLIRTGQGDRRGPRSKPWGVPQVKRWGGELEKEPEGVKKENQVTVAADGRVCWGVGTLPWLPSWTPWEVTSSTVSQGLIRRCVLNWIPRLSEWSTAWPSQVLTHLGLTRTLSFTLSHSSEKEPRYTESKWPARVTQLVSVRIQTQSPWSLSPHTLIPSLSFSRLLFW